MGPKRVPGAGGAEAGKPIDSTGKRKEREPLMPI
jgi:hypothetical protein